MLTDFQEVFYWHPLPKLPLYFKRVDAFPSELLISEKQCT